MPVSVDKCKILNCEICNFKSSTELLHEFDHGVLIPTNVDMVMKLQKDFEFYKAISIADYCVNDSRILYWASRLTGSKMNAVIPGSDLFPLFYNFHKDNKDVTIFLLGAMPGVAYTASQNINKKVNREMVVDVYSPPFGFEKDEKECAKIIEQINQSKATVLGIGLGAPKQEKWIMKYRSMMPTIKMILCIGATIDFEAGTISRAPKVFRTCNLEWFYRLCREPRRLWKRYIVDDIPFFYLIFKQILGIYKDPFKDIKNDN